MSDVTCVVVTALPDLPEPTADLVFPELKVNPVLPEPTVPPVLRALMASQAQMELQVNAALPERRVLKARPALRGLKVLKVDPETANVFVRARSILPHSAATRTLVASEGRLLSRRAIRHSARCDRALH